MDWGNERYVRLYCRPTADWLALCWQAKCCWPLLLKECNRVGLVQVREGQRRMVSLAALMQIPLEVVQPGVTDLLEDGCLSETKEGFFVPNFLEAQECGSTGAERTRKWRDKRRLELLAQALHRPGDETSPEVTTPAQQAALRLGPIPVSLPSPVTKRHKGRRNVAAGGETSPKVTCVTDPVTPCRAVPPSTDVGAQPVVRAVSAVGVVVEADKSPFQKPPPSAELRGQELELWNFIERARYENDLRIEDRPPKFATWAHDALEKSNLDGLCRAYLRYVSCEDFEAHQWRIGVFMSEAVWSVRTAPKRSAR